MFRAALGLLFTAMLVSGALYGNEQPPVFPTRDVVVDVTSLIGPGMTQVTRKFYLAAERKVRAQSDKFNAYAIVDRRSRTMVMVYPGQPPTYRQATYSDEPEGTLVATGKKSRIAGIDCTEWQSPSSVRKNPFAGYPGQRPT